MMTSDDGNDDDDVRDDDDDDDGDDDDDDVRDDGELYSNLKSVKAFLRRFRVLNARDDGFEEHFVITLRHLNEVKQTPQIIQTILNWRSS
jgi:hypothetical protein